MFGHSILGWIVFLGLMSSCQPADDQANEERHLSNDDFSLSDQAANELSDNSDRSITGKIQTKDNSFHFDRDSCWVTCQPLSISTQKVELATAVLNAAKALLKDEEPDVFSVNLLKSALFEGGGVSWNVQFHEKNMDQRFTGRIFVEARVKANLSPVGVTEVVFYKNYL